jgi:hypothetical protein
VRASERCNAFWNPASICPSSASSKKLGFEVKGEVCGCDLAALDGKEPAAVVVGELKLTFTLDLVLQAVDRLAACDEVWLAVLAAVAAANMIAVCANSAVCWASDSSAWHHQDPTGSGPRAARSDHYRRQS